MAKRNKKKTGLQRKVSSVFNRVSIPQREDDAQTNGTPSSEDIVGAPQESERTDTLILQSSLMKKLLRSESSSDKAAIDHTKTAPSERAAPEHPISKDSPIPKPHGGKDKSSEVTPDRTLSVFPKKTTPEPPVPKHPAVEKAPRTKDLSAKETMSRERRIPPKLTTPNHPSKEPSWLENTKQAKRRDKTEPGRTDISDSQKQVAAKYPASQSPGTKKRDQAESTPKTSAPDRTAKAPSSKSADPKSLRHSGSEKRYGPEAPPKEAEASTQHEKTFSEEPSAPSLRQRISDRLFAPKPGASPVRQKVMVVSIPILAIIMIFAFRQVLNQSPRKTKGAPSKDVAGVVEADSGHEIDWQIPEPIPATMRDPTKLPFQNNVQTEEEQEPEEPVNTKKFINLSAIVYSQDKPSAIVNGRIVHVGEQISGITILKINKDSVEFEKNGEKWVQRIRD